ncbi:MAG: UDP-3-O-(3-hydroxymyristoyl)glucosamine N-acyltransferase [Gammaproteobacteria bacterium]
MYTLGELARHIKAEPIGDTDCIIERVATLGNAGKGDITFFSNTRYKSLLRSTNASAVIISKGDRSLLTTNGLLVDDPYVAYARIATLLYPEQPLPTEIHATSAIDPGATIAGSAGVGAHCVIGQGVTIGERSYIGAGTVIENGVTIGDDCRIAGNVTICHGVSIGDRVIVHPGVVIGSDGFGLANDQGRWVKIPQIGSVRIGNDVEVGSNSTIDRGAIDDTIIEDGVKMDNQIQIAHNVHIGAHTAIAGCAAIAGSTRIGKYCQIGGKAGIVGHLEIADHVHITAMSLVTRSLKKPGVYSSGTPLQDNQQWQRNAVRIKQLDELVRRVKVLEQQFNQQKK